MTYNKIYYNSDTKTYLSVWNDMARLSVNGGLLIEVVDTVENITNIIKAYDLVYTDITLYGGLGWRSYKVNIDNNKISYSKVACRG